MALGGPKSAERRRCALCGRGWPDVARECPCCIAGRRSVVLLGDPQQLDQPQQGSHPEGADVSALEHMLGDHKTIPSDRGIFLSETWRLAPSICRFTSEVFYEGRLFPHAGLERQMLVGTAPFEGAGLWVDAVRMREIRTRQSKRLTRSIALSPVSSAPVRNGSTAMALHDR